jgi:hypothetical protein
VTAGYDARAIDRPFLNNILMETSPIPIPRIGASATSSGICTRQPDGKHPKSMDDDGVKMLCPPWVQAWRGKQVGVGLVWGFYGGVTGFACLIKQEYTIVVPQDHLSRFHETRYAASRYH